MFFCFCRLIYLSHRLQKSCDLGAQLSELKKKHINLELNLGLAKKNLKTAQEETAIMGGNQSTLAHLVARVFHCFYFQSL